MASVSDVRDRSNTYAIVVLRQLQFLLKRTPGEDQGEVEARFRQVLQDMTSYAHATGLEHLAGAADEIDAVDITPGAATAGAGAGAGTSAPAPVHNTYG